MLYMSKIVDLNAKCILQLVIHPAGFLIRCPVLFFSSAAAVPGVYVEP